MLRSILTICLFVAGPALAQSAAQEARFAAAIEAVEARTLAFYRTVDPRFEALLVSPAQDPVYRENQRCVLAQIGAEGGADMLEDYVLAMETMGATEITSLIDLGNALPEVMTADLIFAAAADCGAMSWSTEQMATPAFMEIMSEPAVTQRLMGQ